MKVVLYLRVSDKSQNPDNQRFELMEVARRNGWTVINEYCDHGISGAKGRDKRPAFDEMIKSGLRKEYDLVMFWAVDRASRNLTDLVQMMDDFSAKNVGMYFHQQSIDSTTPSGRAMLQMAGVFAQFERSMLKERILAAHNRARAEGKTIGRPSMLNDGIVASVKFMREQGLGIKRISKELGIGVGTVYKAIEA